MKELNIKYRFNNLPLQEDVINEDQIDEYLKIKKVKRNRLQLDPIPGTVTRSAITALPPRNLANARWNGFQYVPLDDPIDPIPGIITRSSVTAQVGGGDLTREALQNAYDSLLNDPIVESRATIRNTPETMGTEIDREIVRIRNAQNRNTRIENNPITRIRR